MSNPIPKIKKNKKIQKESRRGKCHGLFQVCDFIKIEFGCLGRWKAY